MRGWFFFGQQQLKNDFFATFGRNRAVRLSILSAACVLFSSAASQAVPIYYSSQEAATDNGSIGFYDSTTGTNTQNFIPFVDPEELSVSAGNLYVARFRDGTVSEYSASTGASKTGGTPLVSGVTGANGVLISGNNLFVAGSGTVAEYNVNNGVATVENSSLVTGGAQLYQMALSNNTLYVADAYNNAVEAYTLKNNGTTSVTASLAFSVPFGFANGVAIYGNDLFISNQGGDVGEYDATTGASLSSSMYLTVTSSNYATDGAFNLAVTSHYLLVGSYSRGTITQFDINSPNPASSAVTLLSGVDQMTGLAVDTSVPEPCSMGLIGAGSLALLARRRSRV